MEGLQHFPVEATITTWKRIKKHVYSAADRRSMDAGWLLYA